MSNVSLPHRLSELELLGALLGRFMHDLSNETTCLVTTCSLTQNPTPQDWQEVSLSVDRLGAHLRKFNEIVQRVRPGIVLVSSTELLLRFPEICAEFPGWNFLQELTDPITVYGQADWLAGALSEILLELQLRSVVTGDIRVFTILASQLGQLPPPFSSRREEKKYLILEILFSDAGLKVNTDSVLETEHPNWLIIAELIRQMRGHLFWQKKADQQSLLICLSGA